MSQTREALHDILEFAANTDCNMQIRIDTWEGELSITTTIDSTEKAETDKEAIIKRLDLALNDFCWLDNWFETAGHRDCSAHKRLLDVMQNIACLHHELTKEAE